MGDVVKVLTIVPRQIAQTISSDSRIQNYNALPQLSQRAMQIIRGYVTETVGYSNLPMACLVQPDGGYNTNFSDYLPVNAKESVLFSLEMPTDMIVSTNFSSLLEMSKLLEDETDPIEIELLGENLKESLYLGIGEDEDDVISFIPFLDYKRCKFYATFTPSFEQDRNFSIPGLDKINLRELRSFTN